MFTQGCPEYPSQMRIAPSGHFRASQVPTDHDGSNDIANTRQQRHNARSTRCAGA